MVKRKCKQCGKEFVLNNSEIKFFKSKNLELPKRCRDCRRENKNTASTKNDKFIKDINKSNDINSYDVKQNENSNKKSNNKNKILRNIIIAALVLLTLFVGKLFDLNINLQNFGVKSEKGENNVNLQFRSEKLLDEHFEKHGNEFKYSSKEEYLKGANELVNSPSSIHKKEKSEDEDDIYYDKVKNEIVFISKDGFIRTYFKPTDGIDYFNRQ